MVTPSKGEIRGHYKPMQAVERSLKLRRAGECSWSHRESNRSFTVLGVGLVASLVLSSPAAAQTRPTISQSSQSAVGFQGGASIDPEQVFVGVFWDSPPLGGRFWIRPGIDGGFGSDLRVATINIDFIARFPIGRSGWSFVQGGGPVIAITKIPAIDASETSAGGSYIIGFGHDSGFFSEFRIGGGNTEPQDQRGLSAEILRCARALRCARGAGAPRHLTPTARLQGSPCPCLPDARGCGCACARRYTLSCRTTSDGSDALVFIQAS